MFIKQTSNSKVNTESDLAFIETISVSFFNTSSTKFNTNIKRKISREALSLILIFVSKLQHKF